MAVALIVLANVFGSVFKGLLLTGFVWLLITMFVVSAVTDIVLALAYRRR